MLLFWLSLVIFGLSVFGIIKVKDSYYGELWNILFVPVCITSFIVTFSMGISRIEVNSKVEKYIYNYKNCQERIKLYQKESVTFELLFELYDECKEIDNKIEANKNYASVWVGKIYSKTLSELPPLIPQFNKNLSEMYNVKDEFEESNTSKEDNNPQTKWHYYLEEKPDTGAADYVTLIQCDGFEICKINYWINDSWASDDNEVIKWFKIEK